MVISRHEFAVFVLPRHDCYLGRPVSVRGISDGVRVEKMLLSAVKMSASSIAVKLTRCARIQRMTSSEKHTLEFFFFVWP
jgi:hypothetical protein